ncbi:MAG TPA: Fe-S cluster assembly protein SufD [Gemmatales bacterium]|nr:Fe-S cluster assembly protein SufD [Gemmatales bacterium]
MKTIHPAVEQTSKKAELLNAFEGLERQLAGSDTPFLRRLRSAGIARFDQLGFPGSRDEEWRFTPLTSLFQHPFVPAISHHGIDLPELKQQLPAWKEAWQIVSVDGFVEDTLSRLSGLPTGCTVMSLSEAIKARPDQVEAALARHAHFENNTFAALNTAFVQDGVFIHLAKNCVVEQPIHLAFIESGRGRMSFPRILVVAEKHSQATIIETYQTLGEQADCTTAVSEYILADEARLDHYRLNEASKKTFHFASQHTRLARGSYFRSHCFTLGGGLVRNDLFACFTAENGECTLNGLYTVDGSRLIDNHTTIDHAMPHCNSHEVYKGIIAGKGKGVFNGKIFVRQDAQKTDAKQTNQTLLLSPDAMIDTKPQLEIFADDVKCTHGATVGQLDAEMMFYLRSRGLGKDEAQGILTYAFANDIIGKVEVPALRDILEKRFLPV